MNTKGGPENSCFFEKHQLSRERGRERERERPIPGSCVRRYAWPVFVCLIHGAGEGCSPKLRRGDDEL